MTKTRSTAEQSDKEFRQNVGLNVYNHMMMWWGRLGGNYNKIIVFKKKKTVPYSDCQYDYYYSDQHHGDENAAHHIHSFARNICIATATLSHVQT